MKSLSINFLKIALLLIAIGTLVGLLWFPQTEGRAAQLDLLSIYLDPLIIYVYISSLPFFVSLCLSYNLLNQNTTSNIFSQKSINIIRNIKYCYISEVVLVGAAVIYLFIFERAKSDDIAGGVMTGIFIMFVFTTAASIADTLQRIIQKVAVQDKDTYYDKNIR